MISLDSLASEFAPARLVKAPDASARDGSTEPKGSFFRGVMIGLAVAIPVWAWILWSIL